MSALINMFFIISKVGHGVNLCDGTSEDPVLSWIKDCKDAIQRLPFKIRSGEPVEWGLVSNISVHKDCGNVALTWFYSPSWTCSRLHKWQEWLPGLRWRHDLSLFSPRDHIFCANFGSCLQHHLSIQDWYDTGSWDVPELDQEWYSSQLWRCYVSNETQSVWKSLGQLPLAKHENLSMKPFSNTTKQYVERC